MNTIFIQAVDKEDGKVVYTAVEVPEDYTMVRIAEAIKEKGYSQFKIMSMEKFVKV